MNYFKFFLLFSLCFFLVEAKALRIIENTDFGLRPDGKLGEYPHPANTKTYTIKTSEQVRGQDSNQNNYAIDVRKAPNNLLTVFESKYKRGGDGGLSEDEKSIDFESIHVTTLNGMKVTSYTKCVRSIEKWKLKVKNLQNLTSCMTLNEKFCSKFTAQMKKSHNPNDQKDRAFLFVNEFLRTEVDYPMTAKSGMDVALSYTDELIHNLDPQKSKKAAESSKDNLWGQFKENFLEKVTETHNEPLGLLKERKQFDSENITDLIFKKCQELGL